MAAPTATGMPSPTIPEQPKLGSTEKRCMWPPFPRPSPVSRPKISAAILLRSTPCAIARWWGRWVAVMASPASRWGRIPTATGSCPAERCISPGMRPAAMSKAGSLSAR